MSNNYGWHVKMSLQNNFLLLIKKFLYFWSANIKLEKINMPYIEL